LTPARSIILEQLQQLAEPTTATAMAAQLGQHANTVREHLEALVERGLAKREPAPVNGRGRPGWIYSPAASTPEPDTRVRHYTALALALAAQIKRSSRHPEREALAAGEAWGQGLVAGSRPMAATPARRRLLKVLADLGFDPRADARGTTVRVFRCPLLDAARQEPDVVCMVHLGLVRGVLAGLGAPHAQASIHPFAEPDACVLHLGRSA
jgi:predicted ArsR family transcriptional regulator